MILERIVADKRSELAREKELIPLKELKSMASSAKVPRDFLAALKEPGLSLIAEVKKASPSAGIIRQDFRPERIAKEYQAGGASAISVITERSHFLGDPAYLKEAKKAVSLPILRKDFIIDEYQLYESRAIGADAVLLITALLSVEELKGFLELCEELGLSAMVEVHNAAEVKRAQGAGAKIIGINNRDLKTFKVDLETTFRLKEKIAPDIIVVSESGIKDRGDIERLKGAGLDGVLIGETLIRSDNILAKIAELFK